MKEQPLVTMTFGLPLVKRKPIKHTKEFITLDCYPLKTLNPQTPDFPAIQEFINYTNPIVQIKQKRVIEDLEAKHRSPNSFIIMRCHVSGLFSATGKKPTIWIISSAASRIWKRLTRWRIFYEYLAIYSKEWHDIYTSYEKKGPKDFRPEGTFHTFRVALAKNAKKSTKSDRPRVSRGVRKKSVKSRV
ncbi:hypothetical protein DICA3_B02234 [Diutina catenulata]